MKKESKNRIIEILEEYGGLIGVDSKETEKLISEMKQIRALEVEPTLVQEIQDYMTYICQLIGYEPTEENNNSRKMEIIGIRDAIARHTFDKYGSLVVTRKVVSDFFGKDRASGYQIEKRTQFRLEINDSLLVPVYNRITVALNIAA